jgi:hypothetical protein
MLHCTVDISGKPLKTCKKAKVTTFHCLGVRKILHSKKRGGFLRKNLFIRRHKKPAVDDDIKPEVEGKPETA